MTDNIIHPDQLAGIEILIRGNDGKLEYAAITGSHSWNLATPTSDIDIRGIYAWSLERALSLRPGRDNRQGTWGIVDFQVYEFAKALRMLLSANGNVVELLLNPLCCKCSEWGERLRVLARASLTKRLSNYYLGYATSQRKRAMQNRGGKALVYTYREMYAGIYLMIAGRIVFDFQELRSLIEPQWYESKVLPYGLEHRHDPTPGDIMRDFEREWEELEQIFRRERDRSLLADQEPADFANRCDALLYERRMKGIS